MATSRPPRSRPTSQQRSPRRGDPTCRRNFYAIWRCKRFGRVIYPCHHAVNLILKGSFGALTRRLNTGPIFQLTIILDSSDPGAPPHRDGQKKSGVARYVRRLALMPADRSPRTPGKEPETLVTVRIRNAHTRAGYILDFTRSIYQKARLDTGRISRGDQVGFADAPLCPLFGMLG
jgi:hypothetical protein